VSFIGVDGCRGGWVAVRIDGRRRDFRLLRRIDALHTLAARRVLVDIPIGLPPTGRRACDLAARRMLGAARSRLFLDARRPLLDYLGAADYSGANRWAKRDGKGVSRQLWNILGKIAEVDRFITPAQQDIVLEAHPELAFMRLAGGAALPNKKTEAGERERRDLVRRAGLAEIDDWLERRPREIAADDLLDAAALALAARAPTRVASPAARDARGLRMEIWY
jgi:predicted RNase H-like nuclease